MSSQKLNENNDKNKEENKSLNSHCIIIISKYFKTIHDYVNIVKCCKEYSTIIDQYKYNPFPFHNKKERNIFKNIKEYH